MDTDILNEMKRKLLDINKTITSLDPAIRAAAFDILASYCFNEDELPAGEDHNAKGKKRGSKPEPTGSIEKFVAVHEHTKPADNVFLIAAWIYSRYGKQPITPKMCQVISDEASLTIPDRPDNTMRFAKRKGKSLFRKQGKGWIPTTHGEIFLKDTYDVIKGNTPLPGSYEE